MILLDTNIISELLRAQPNPMVVNWLDKQLPENLYISSMTLAELQVGVSFLPEGKRKRTLQTQVEAVQSLYIDHILPFDEQCTPFFAEIGAKTRKQGIAIQTADAIIAAIAMRHQFIVATRDETPFQAAGLRVINPWTAS